MTKSVLSSKKDLQLNEAKILSAQDKMAQELLSEPIEEIEDIQKPILLKTGNVIKKLK